MTRSTQDDSRVTRLGRHAGDGTGGVVVERRLGCRSSRTAPGHDHARQARDGEGASLATLGAAWPAEWTSGRDRQAWAITSVPFEAGMQQAAIDGGSHRPMPEQDVVVPEVAESVAEVTILNWHKAVGEFVEADEALAEVETDKANVDMPRPLRAWSRRTSPPSVTRSPSATVAAKIDTDKTAGDASRREPEDDRRRPPAGTPKRPRPSPPASPTRAKLADLSPAVRRIVSENKLDADDIKATGPSGRLTKEDVLCFRRQPEDRPAGDATACREAAKPAAVKAPAPATASSIGASGQTTRRVTMSKIRRSIARNLLAAQQNAAILTTFNEVDLTEVMALRKKYKEPFGEKHGVGLGFMSFFSKAAAVALSGVRARQRPHRRRRHRLPRLRQPRRRGQHRAWPDGAGDQERAGHVVRDGREGDQARRPGRP